MNDKPINREKQKQAHQLCTNLAPYSWNEFAKSLVEFFNERGFLTDKQMDNRFGNSKDIRQANYIRDLNLNEKQGKAAINQITQG